MIKAVEKNKTQSREREIRDAGVNVGLQLRAFRKRDERDIVIKI